MGTVSVRVMSPVGRLPFKQPSGRPNKRWSTELLNNGVYVNGLYLSEFIVSHARECVYLSELQYLHAARMGLHTDVKKHILTEDEKTRLIWKSRRKMPIYLRGANIKDELTAVRTWHSWDEKGQARRGLTGEQAFAAWYKYHRKVWERGFKYSVSCWDDATRVPSQKGGTQDKRADTKASKASPAYASGSYIVNAGVVEPGPAGAMLQLIDVNRLANTRDMRTVICNYFMTKLQGYSLPKDTCLILDFDPAGPWQRESNSAWIQRTDLLHPCGEADLMIPFWCRLLRKVDIYVDTIDGDIFLILINYWHRHRQYQCDIAYEWRRNAKNRGYIDMKLMHEAMGDRLWPFTLACAACGTDFLKKKGLTHGIGTNTVLKWAMDSDNQFKDQSKWDLSTMIADEPNVWPYPLASPILLRQHTIEEEIRRGYRTKSRPVEVAASSASSSTASALSSTALGSWRSKDPRARNEEPDPSATPRLLQAMIESVFAFHVKAGGRRPKTQPVVDRATAARFAWYLQYITIDLRCVTATVTPLASFLNKEHPAEPPDAWE